MTDRRQRGIAEELIAYLIAFVLIVGILIFSFTHQRAETPTVIVGPGAKVSTTEKSDSGWAFGLGTIATLAVVIGGVIIAKRQQH
jgi:hypothetical protein